MKVYTIIRNSTRGKSVFSTIKDSGYRYITGDPLLEAHELCLPCGITVDTELKTLDYDRKGQYVTYKEIIAIINNIL